MHRPLALLLVLAPAANADTITVAVSGADYTKIEIAVAVAAPGDLVLVAAGTYTSSNPIVIDKPLTLLGAGSENTTFILAGDLFGVGVPIVVSGLAAGEEVRVAGFTFAGSTFSMNPGPASIAVVECTGPVVLADIRGYGSTVSGSYDGVAMVYDSAQVIVDSCSFSVFPHNQHPSCALYIENSTVTVNDGLVFGASSSPAIGVPSFPGWDGGPALIANGSVVRISRTTVQGGRGAWSDFITVTKLTVGGHAIVATASTINGRGGAGNLLQGGQGGSAVIAGVPTEGAGGSALVLDALSSATIAADAVVLAGPDGDGVIQQPAVLGPGQSTALGFALATLSSEPSIVAPGAAASLELGGEPGAVALTFFSTTQLPAYTLAGIFGTVVLPVAGALPLPTKVLNGAGLAEIVVPIPPGTALIGLTGLLQTVQIDGAGRVSVSPPAAVAIYSQLAIFP